MNDLIVIFLGAYSGKFGALLMLIFALSSIFCLRIWLVVVAFRTSIWWAIAVFIIPLADILFTLFNWKAAKKPFLYGIFFLSLAVGTFISRSFVQTFFNLQPIELDADKSKSNSALEKGKREFIRTPNSASTSHLEFRLVNPGMSINRDDILNQNDSRISADVFLSNDDIEKVILDERYHQVIVELQFTSKGAEKLEDFSRNAIGRYVAIVLNGRVLLAPRINEAISGGSLQISGGLTREEGEKVAKRIVGELG